VTPERIQRNTGNDVGPAASTFEGSMIRLDRCSLLFTQRFWAYEARWDFHMALSRYSSLYIAFRLLPSDAFRSGFYVIEEWNRGLPYCLGN
jgi:hypothetical protein